MTVANTSTNWPDTDYETSRNEFIKALENGVFNPDVHLVTGQINNVVQLTATIGFGWDLDQQTLATTRSVFAAARHAL